MAAYALRRLLLALATLWLAGSLVFLFLLLLPGDPVQAILGLEASPEARAALERSLGLDRPPLERYLAWLWGLLQLDLGESIRYAKPVLALILERLPLTLALTALGLLGALSLALPLALLALRHRALDLRSGRPHGPLAVPSHLLPGGGPPLRPGRPPSPFSRRRVSRVG